MSEELSVPTRTSKKSQKQKKYEESDDETETDATSVTETESDASSEDDAKPKSFLDLVWDNMAYIALATAVIVCIIILVYNYTIRDIKPSSDNQQKRAELSEGIEMYATMLPVQVPPTPPVDYEAKIRELQEEQAEDPAPIKPVRPPPIVNQSVDSQSAAGQPTATESRYPGSSLSPAESVAKYATPPPETSEPTKSVRFVSDPPVSHSIEETNKGHPAEAEGYDVLPGF